MAVSAIPGWFGRIPEISAWHEPCISKTNTVAHWGQTTVWLRSQSVAAEAERLAFLEGRVVEHSRQIDGIRGAIEGLDSKMSRQFMWLVGIQVTTLVAIVAALVTR